MSENDLTVQSEGEPVPAPTMDGTSTEELESGSAERSGTAAGSSVASAGSGDAAVAAGVADVGETVSPVGETPAPVHDVSVLTGEPTEPSPELAVVEAEAGSSDALLLESVPEPSAEVLAAAAALARAFGDEPASDPAESATAARLAGEDGQDGEPGQTDTGEGTSAAGPRPSPGRVRARKTVQLPTKTSWQVRIDDDSQVWITTSAGERLLGPAAGVGELALGTYVRAFEELALDVQLIEQRAAAGIDLGAVRTKAQGVRDSLATVPAAGDLDAIAIRLETVLALLSDRQRNVQAERAAIKAQIVAAKTVLAEEAESLAQSVEWKKSGDRFLALVEDWKRLPVTDRTGDTELWKRIRASRDEFGRRRGAHFSELEQTRAAVKAAKEKIVMAAEELSVSREWGPTASKFGDLMTQWKASGRAERHVDDQLWARFKKAQDAFFSARSEHFSERTGAEKANLATKEGLLAEAEKLVPVTNADAAKRALRAIQDRWEKVGHVPREAMGRLEKRLEVVEKAISDAAPSRPSTAKVRESQLVIRLRESVAKLEKDLTRATAANKRSDVAKIEASLKTQNEWLAQALRSA